MLGKCLIAFHFYMDYREGAIKRYYLTSYFWQLAPSVFFFFGNFFPFYYLRCNVHPVKLIRIFYICVCPLTIPRSSYWVFPEPCSLLRHRSPVEPSPAATVLISVTIGFAELESHSRHPALRLWKSFRLLQVAVVFFYCWVIFCGRKNHSLSVHLLIDVEVVFSCFDYY